MSTSTSAATKAAKTVTKKEKAAPAAPAPAAPAAPAPAAPAAEKKAPKAKAAKEAAPAPAAPAPVVAAPVVAAPAEAEAPVASVQDDVKAMLTQANTVRETVGALVAELKRLEKRVARLQKEADKRKRRVKKVEGDGSAPRKPSIFETPTALSPELCSFLGVAAGSKDSRSNVTRAITKYVKENNLKNKHNITPDAKLKGLLGVPEGETLTYFNLQRYLNRHYLKAVAPTA
jgi:chromatin remodeling complex protein RSC6